jgi:predicted porin
MYLNYGLDTERGVNGVHARRGNLVGGAETRFSDSASVFVESRFQHSKAETGLTRAVGMNYSPSERWDISGNLELGTLSDRRTKAETDRRAVSATVTYHIDEFLISSGIEYLFDDSENPEGGSSDRTTWLFRNQLKYQMTPDWKLVAKFNHSFSDSSLGDFFDGGFTEAVLGYAYRPVKHDRLNALLKYTYFYNLPTAGQVSPSGTSPSEFIQKSHIAALDVSYDVLPNLSLGGKYAYRRGEVSLDRDNPEFFDNSAHLAVLRADLRFLKNWEALVEGRALILPEIDERKVGALLGLNRYFGKNFKAGVGYNFTDFSDDLTDLDYDHHGWFLTMTGAF